jgi:hypothetical protein
LTIASNLPLLPPIRSALTVLSGPYPTLGVGPPLLLEKLTAFSLTCLNNPGLLYGTGARPPWVPPLGPDPDPGVGVGVGVFFPFAC